MLGEKTQPLMVSLLPRADAALGAHGADRHRRALPDMNPTPCPSPRSNSSCCAGVRVQRRSVSPRRCKFCFRWVFNWKEIWFL